MVMLMRHDLQQDIARREVPVSLESLRAVREFVAIQSSELTEDVAGLLTVVGSHIIQGASDRVDYLHHEGVNTVRLWIDVPHVNGLPPGGQAIASTRSSR